MNISELSQHFAIPGHVEFIEGPGGLPQIRIANTAATALISVYGGQVLSYHRHGEDELLFLSERAYYADGKAIKGGVPVCWPWFGADPEGKGRPAHGFVRTRMWTVGATAQPEPGLTRIELQLHDDDTTRALWPHRFALSMVVTIGDVLDLALVTHNTGEQAFDITQALHTYFAVGDIAQVGIAGLDGSRYLDKVRDFAVFDQSGTVMFDGEVDRIYQRVQGPLTISDPVLGRRIDIDCSGSTTTVVWNPWKEIAIAMQDLADDDYRRLVCVETANAADEIVTIEPGTQYRLGARYRHSSLARP